MNLDLIKTFWQLLSRQRWDDALKLLHPRFVAVWPQSKERIVGPRNFIDVNRFYPGNHKIEWVHGLEVAGKVITTVWIEADTGQKTFANSYFDIEDGKIIRAEEYWAEPYPAPEWRKQWVEIDRMSTVTKNIVALGGGGFSEEPDNPLLDRYILNLSPKQKPKVCFIPTASGDSDGYVARFYEAFKKFDCTPTHLSLFKGITADLEGFVSDVDIVYVGGGNTRNLMTLWRDWGLDQILRRAWDRGVVLAGISAGSLCWFAQGVTDSIPGTLSPVQCLGFLPGSNCVHYDGEAGRRPAYHRLLQEGSIQPGIAAEDGVALHFRGQKLIRIVSSRPDRKAYRLEMAGGKSVEHPIKAEYLGNKDHP